MWEPLTMGPQNMMMEEDRNQRQMWQHDQDMIARDFNSAEAVKQRDFTERMSNTQYQRATADMQKAGLNPMLAYHQGGASSGPGSAATSAQGGSVSTAYSPSGSGHSSAPAAYQTASQIQVNEAVIKRTAAETSKIEAEEGEIRERTPTHAVSIDQMRQNITESQERIQKIIQETSTSYFSAENLKQQTVNLQAILPQITATINNLRAQTKQTQTLTGKTEEETKEIRQRIAAALPQLEAALKRLEQQSREAGLPAQEQARSVHESFTGSLGAVLRALNPLNNFLR